jgi:radical SAM enzyme (TIGR01210 family)
MCPLPDESVPNNIIITDEDIKQQIDAAFINSDACDVLTVYHNGNFFADKELSDNVREYIYTRVANSNFKNLVVESLPQFITRNKLDKARAKLSGKIMQVAIGLQSWDDDIREYAINSTCTKDKFLEANALLKEFGYSAQVFLMFKPPFLSVQESIDDLVNGVVKLHKIGIDDPIICPMRVAKHTVVHALFNRGEYIPPTLWQLVQAIKNIHERVPNTLCRIAITCLNEFDKIYSIRATACKKCADKIIKELSEYNHTHNISGVKRLTCECKTGGFLNYPYEGSVKERVAAFVLTTKELTI